MAAVAATLTRVEVEIDDTALKAPRAGRVQFRVAQPGEVLGGGGKVLNLVDLSDVYMAFFLPETVAGVHQQKCMVLNAIRGYFVIGSR